MAVLISVSGCVAVPQTANVYPDGCETTTAKKTLRVLNVSGNSDYSVANSQTNAELLPTVLVLPLSAAVSGSYVVANNLLHAGEKLARCD